MTSGSGRGALPPVGVRLGVDVGSVRVGVAVSDPGGILATPVETLHRDADGNTDVDRLAQLVTDRRVVEVVVGLPRTLHGTNGPAAEAARAYAVLLSDRIGDVPIVFVDERMTSVVANRALAAGGRNSRSRRTIVDQAAAMEILQTRLDAVRERHV